MKRPDKFIYTNRKRSYRKKLNYKRLSILVLGCIVILTALGIGAKNIMSYAEEKKAQKIELKNQEKEDQILADKKHKEEEEEKKRKEEEKKKMMIGVGPNGKAYADDAVEVSNKLRTYDYSNDGKKVVYLTFDDGTSTTNTPSVLKTLKNNNVKATFFITGSNLLRGGQKAKDLLKEELNEGHAIANHSYSHDYSILYPHRTLNFDNFKADFDKNDKILKDVLGPYFSTRVIRCPGGHMSWNNMKPLDDYMKTKNMASIDWDAVDGDAEGGKKDANTLYNEAVKTSKGMNLVVILMHDTYGKEETAKALPQIIKYFKDSGYEFRTLA